MSGQCRTAAVRAYRELRKRGENEISAFKTSVVIYRHYHPDSEIDQARDLVAGWIEEELSEPLVAHDGVATIDRTSPRQT